MLKYPGTSKSQKLLPSRPKGKKLFPEPSKCYSQWGGAAPVETEIIEKECRLAKPGCQRQGSGEIKKLNSLLPLVKSDWKEARGRRRSLRQSAESLPSAQSRADNGSGGNLAYPPFFRLVLPLTQYVTKNPFHARGSPGKLWLATPWLLIKH